MNNTRRDCEAFRDELAAWVDGDISPSAAEHLTECDECRDLRHDARNVARAITAAGRDYQPPSNTLDKVLAALDARPQPTHPTPAAPVVATASATASATQPISQTVPLEASKLPVVQAQVPPPVRAPSPLELVAVPRSGNRFTAVVALCTMAAVVTLIAVRERQVPKPTAALSATGAYSASLWHGHITRVVRAASDQQGGVEVRLPGASGFTAAGESAPIAPGSTLRTDARTRARIDLDDGTVLVLDRATELLLDPSAPRSARMLRGNLVAEVMPRGSAAPPARIAMPVGGVEVLGTKFALSASEDRSSVRVTRGTVRLFNGSQSAEVKTGQEGLIARDESPSVSPAVDIAGAVSWSEFGGAHQPADTALVGIGELRARRPGSSAERDEAIHLASHSVKIRIVGNMARTEIEEVFRNDTAQELEGIYRFPLPPDGQIEQLSLDVNGRMEQGSFVDRDRAAAIWRGVIRHATPHPLQTVEEYIWVPGPWHDPALLEWQRGGRFELRIFPIPARGSRRVVLSYTQTIQASGGQRRYVYPLPHDPGGSLNIDNFGLDVQVMGNDRAQGVRAVGYAMQPAQSDNSTAQRFQMSAQGFVPSGDLMIEYALPNRAGAVSSWAFQPTGTVVPAAPSAGHLVSNDAFVAFALRPTLPRWGDSSARDYVFVVDSSRSMVGERSERAARLVEAMISEMDRRDRFTVLACDTRCQPFTTGSPGEASPSSAEGARSARSFLGNIERAGGSDLGEAVRSAMAHAPAGTDRDLRVVYLGDGAATVGYRRPDRIAREVSYALRNRRATLTTVALGTDSDTLVLGAMARAGGGAMVPYVPGERVGRAALGVLEATYGVSLRDPVLTLPAGLTEVAPTRLANIRAGSETLVVARMHSSDVVGEAVLRGTVGGEPFEARYPINVRSTTDAGNAFVPRLYAATRIADLEAEATPAAKAEAIALSQRFNVASRYTSLLVLESAAMFQAFGVSRNTQGVAWTGEQSAVATNSTGTDNEAQSEDATDGLGALGDTAARSGGGGQSLARGARRSRSEAGGADMLDSDEPSAPPRSPSSPSPAARPSVSYPMLLRREAGQERDRGDLRSTNGVGSVVSGPLLPSRSAANRAPPLGLLGRRGGQWMRRIWVRHAAISLSSDSASSSVSSHITETRRALLSMPDSRDRHRELFRWLSVAGELNEATEVVARWTTRDALDPDALTRLADLTARLGDRARSLRLLSGVIDLRQDNARALERMALVHERAGQADEACAYRLSLAELRPTDPQVLSRAVRCERSRGRSEQASRWVDELTDPTARAQVERLASAPETVSDSARGDLVVDASWDSGADLDISVIDPRGMRMSWQGGRSGLSSRGPMSTLGESLGVSRASAGDYLIEVSRTDLHGAATTVNTVVRGRLAVSVLGERRSFPFTLDTGRIRVARVSVTREAQMVPAGFEMVSGSFER